jgi:hypothetical protein
MDFLTLFPYIGIIVLVVINALLVLKRDVTVDDGDHTSER